ncbi:ANTAR domain-containing protein [Streptomyces sp. NPDC048419]|uniref:ANTAR domain-containing protein n=1 Tax=Streptomyces sp. NPDC048419 TaxID=3365547 RepID=UPI003721ED14
MEHPYDEDADRADPRPVPGQEVFQHQISDLKEEVSQLNQALDSHAVIDQAIGVVSALGGIEPERCLQVLTEVSQHTNIKLRRVAEHIVAWAHSQEMPDVIRQALDTALTRNTAS